MEGETPSAVKDMIQELLKAEPLTLILLTVILLLSFLIFLSYKLIPLIATSKEKERRGWDKKQTDDYAKYSRVEEIATRVHRLVGDVTIANGLAMKVKDLEDDMDRQKHDSGDLRRQIADALGGQRELHAKIDGVGVALGRVEEGQKIITQTLLGFIPKNGGHV